MNELLNNPVIQAALVLVIVTACNLLVAWLKQKFPTQNALIEANWCYLQPVVESAMAAAKEAGGKYNLDSGVGAKIVLSALTQFAESYRKLEGKQPTDSEVGAARVEITAAINRAVGG